MNEMTDEELYALAQAYVEMYGSHPAGYLGRQLMRLLDEKREAKRYTILSDGDNRRHLCPVDQVEEYHRRVSAHLAFWGQFEPVGEPPPSHEEIPGVMSIDGFRFTFTDPQELS